jgi:hypothetical protein
MPDTDDQTPPAEPTPPNPPAPVGDEVARLKAKNEELLRKLANHDAKGLPPGVDAAKVQELMEFRQKHEQAELESQGKYAEARQKLEEQFRTRETELTGKIAALEAKVRELSVLTPAVSALRDVVHEPADFLKLRLKPEQLATEDDGTVVVVDGYTRTPLADWAKANGKAFELRAPKPQGTGAPSGGSGPATLPSGVKNPFKAESFNLTEQARLFVSSPDLYERLKREAGR